MTSVHVSDERGAVLVLVAVSLTALMAIAALAIDGGNLYRTRGQLQNTADHVAMAAAYADCTGGDPVAVGFAQAAANGFAHDGAATVVTVSEDGGAWRASVTHSFGGFFSALIGAERLTTWGDAVAACQPAGGDGYAIFAGGNNCGSETLDWSGSRVTVNGAVHTNGGVDMGGSNNVVNGSATRVSGGGSSGGVSWTTTDAQPMPSVLGDLTWADFVPISRGGTGLVESMVGSDYYRYVHGKLELKNYAQGNGFVPPRIYVARDSVVVGDSDLWGAVTLVAAASGSNRDESVEFSGSDLNLTPFWNGILAVSFGRKSNPGSSNNCDFEAIKISGSGSHMEGIIYAPYSQVEHSGSNSVIDASLIGWSVKLNGSTMTISSYSGGAGGGDPTILLEQ